MYCVLYVVVHVPEHWRAGDAVHGRRVHPGPRHDHQRRAEKRHPLASRHRERQRQAPEESLQGMPLTRNIQNLVHIRT